MTYNGISEGSVATYTTFGSYLVNGSQTFNTTCRNDEWDRLPNISVTIGTYVPCAVMCEFLSIYMTGARHS